MRTDPECHKSLVVTRSPDYSLDRGFEPGSRDSMFVDESGWRRKKASACKEVGPAFASPNGVDCIFVERHLLSSSVITILAQLTTHEM